MTNPQSTKAAWNTVKVAKRPPTLARPIQASVSEMPPMHRVSTHQHPWGQLAYASRGILKITIPNGSFIVPPQQAMWLPPGTPHEVSTRYGASFRSLYIADDWAQELPEQPQTLRVDNLLKELILTAAQWPQNYTLSATNTRLLQVLVDRIAGASRTPLYLPMPSDKRLKPIVNHLSSNPANNQTLIQWATEVGACSRTLNRLFNRETGMGFNQWRQQLRLLYSLELIENGHNITSVALDLGYDSSSAFITMFKKQLGQSPKQYVKQHQQQRGHEHYLPPELSG